MSELRWDEIDRRAVDTARVLAADAVREGRQRSPGHGDEPGPGGVPAVPAGHAPRPGRHALARARPVHPVGRPLVAHPVRAAVPRRLRPRARRPRRRCARGARRRRATPSTATPTASRSRPARSARASPPRSASPTRPATSAACSTPRRRAGHEPVRPLRLRDRRRRRPAGGRHQRGVARSPATSSSATSIAIYDSNQISIEDDTNVAFTEDVAQRYESYGWHVQTVDWKKTGEYVEDVAELYAAIEAAKGETDKPSLIILKTIIGWPAPEQAEHRQDPRLRARRRRARRDQEGARLRPRADLRRRRRRHRAHPRGSVERGAAAHAEWQERFDAWAAANPERKALLDRLAGARAARGHRRRAARVRGRQGRLDPRRVRQGHQRARRRSCPSCGAARPTSPSRTSRRSRARSRSSPSEWSTHEWTGDPYGRVLHFGIREHAMGAIVNGIVLHGPTRAVRRHVPDLQRLHAPRGAPRRAHEHPVDLRLDARLGRARRGRPDPPADRAARDAARDPELRPSCAPPTRTRPPCAWLEILAPPRRPRRHRADPPEHPGVRARRRRGIRRRVRRGRARRQGRVRARRGAERHPRRDPHRDRLRGAARRRGPRDARRPRASTPASCRRRALEWFDEQDAAYRESVLPAAVTARVSVEAGIALPWRGIVGDTRPHASRSSTSARRPTTRPCSRSSASPPRPSSRPHGVARAAQHAIRGEQRMSTPTAAAVRRRRQHLARRPVARAHQLRQPRRADRRPATSSASPRTRRSSPARSANGATRTTRRSPSSPRHGATRRRGDLRDHDRRRARRRATSSARSTTPPTASTAACRSRSPPTSPTTPTARSPRPRSCGPRSTAPTRSSRSPRPRPASRRSPRTIARGHQRQRHPDLQPRALRARSSTRTSPASSRPRPPATTSRTIHSVASFFVSRVDTEIDKRLDAIGTDEAARAQGQGRHRERAPRLRAVRAGVRHRPRAGAASLPAPTCSARCGPRPA